MPRKFRRRIAGVNFLPKLYDSTTEWALTVQKVAEKLDVQGYFVVSLTAYSKVIAHEMAAGMPPPWATSSQR
jgi:hypothetical protein